MDLIGRRAIVAVSAKGRDRPRIVLARVSTAHVVSVSESVPGQLPAEIAASGGTLVLLAMRELEGPARFHVLYHPDLSVHALRVAGASTAWIACTCRMLCAGDGMPGVMADAWVDDVDWQEAAGWGAAPHSGGAPVPTSL